MGPDNPRNLPASVRQRLLNRACERGEDFNYLLTRYANERLLYRLSRSRYRQEFVHKGTTLFETWDETEAQATRDVDLLRFGEPTTERLRLLFRELCTLDVQRDGLHFIEDTVRASTMRDQDAYGGIRIHLTADLDGARIARCRYTSASATR